MKIYITKGLPGSGKTTWAKEHQAKNPKTVIICKDDLRDMLWSGNWKPEREQAVVRAQTQLIRNAIDYGFDVIVADTNLCKTHEARIRQLFGSEAEIIIQDFTDVPVDKCIANDLKRTRSVGKDVILRMWDQYMRDEPSTIKGLPDAIIVDIDGTLAINSSGRSHYDDTRYQEDEVNVAVLRAVNSLANTHKVIVVSGRMATPTGMQQTIDWLAKHGINPHAFYMRGNGDNRSDDIVKEEIYENHIKGRYNVLAVFDDRPRVIRMWRKYGLHVFDCGLGYEF